MTQRHCFVTDVGNAIEALASALDPERKPPFKGDILDLLEWATKDVLAMRQQLAEHVYWQDQLRQQLQEVCNAIGSPEYMDPPDGGSVTVAEQVSRMREDRDQLRQQVTLLRRALKQAYADIAGLHDQLEEPQINQDDYRLNKIELKESRQQVTLLRDAMEAAWQDGYGFCGAEG